MPAPRVFLSYAWDSPDNHPWVERLATRLCADGVEARLDVWDHRAGATTEAMTAEIASADAVLVICTPEYRRKAQEEGSGPRSGVGWECALLQGEMRSGRLRDRIFPLLRAGDAATALPTFLADQRWFDLRAEALDMGIYAELLGLLYARPSRRPEPGSPPDLSQTPLAPLRGGPAETLLVPYLPLHAYVNRPQLTAALEASLDPDGPGPEGPVVLQGLAGSGKTWLALHYAHLNVARFETVSWVDCGANTAVEGMAALARALGVHATETTPVDIRATAVRAAFERGRRALLIFDNVEGLESIAPVLPRIGTTRVLVLTRRRDVSGARMLVSSWMEEDEALETLLGRPPADRRERGVALALASLLGRLPLALAVAQGATAHGGWRIQELLDWLRVDGPEALFDGSTGAPVPTLPRLFEGSLRHVDAATAVGATARAYLAAAGHLGSVWMPRSLLEAAVARLEPERPPPVLRNGLGVLVRAGLAQLDLASDQVFFHALVQAWGRGMRTAEAGWAVREVLSDPLHGDVAMPMSAARAHLEAAVAGLDATSPAAHVLLGSALAAALLSALELPRARALATRLAALPVAAERETGVAEVGLMILLGDGRRDEAAARAEELATRFDDDAWALMARAIRLLPRGDRPPATNYGEQVRSLIAQSAAMLSEHSAAAASPFLLGLALTQARALAAAEGIPVDPIIDQWIQANLNWRDVDVSFASHLPASEEDRIELLEAAPMLGIRAAIAATTKPSAAEIEQMIAAVESGGDDPVVTPTRVLLAQLLIQIGKRTDAIRHLDTAIRVLKASPGAADGFLVLARILRGSLALDHNDREGARAQLEPAVAASRNYAARHHNTALALVLYRQAHAPNEEADAVIADLVEAVAIFEDLPEPSPGKVAWARVFLIERLRAYGHLEALGHQLDALDAFDPAALESTELAEAVASSASKTKLWPLAVRWWSRVETAIEAGSPYRDPWRAFNRSGNARFRCGDFEGAEARFRRALDSAIHANVDADEEGQIRYNLGNTLHKQGRDAEAIPWLEQAIALRSTRPAKLASARTLLAEVLGAQGRPLAAAAQLAAICESSLERKTRERARVRWLVELRNAGQTAGFEDWDALIQSTPDSSTERETVRMAALEAHAAAGRHRAAERTASDLMRDAAGAPPGTGTSPLEERIAELVREAGSDPGSRDHADGLAAFRAGRFGVARRAFERALRARREMLAPPKRIADSAHSLGHSLVELGLAGAAIPLLTEALRLREAAGDAAGIARSTTMLKRARGRVGKRRGPGPPPRRRRR